MSTLFGLVKKIVGSDDYTSDERVIALGWLQPPENASDHHDSIVEGDVAEVKEQAATPDDAKSLTIETPSNGRPSDLLTREQVSDLTGYDLTWPDWTSRRYPDAITRYRSGDGKRLLYSKADIERYLAEREKPRKRRARGMTGQTVSRFATPDEIAEFDCISGAAKRTGLTRDKIAEMLKYRSISSRVIGDGSGKSQNRQVIVSVAEVRARTEGRKYVTTWSPFDSRKWMTIVDAASLLGLNETDRREISDACMNRKIASRKIGRNRFVLVSDVERWYLSR